MAGIEQHVRAEKAWIARCRDVGALMDRIAEWREDARVGAREGNALLRMRASDLLELAEERVVALKAVALQAAAPPMPAEAIGSATPSTSSPDRADREHARREAEEELARQERAAAVRLATAKAAAMEANAAALRQQGASAAVRRQPSRHPTPAPTVASASAPPAIRAQDRPVRSPAPSRTAASPVQAASRPASPPPAHPAAPSPTDRTARAPTAHPPAAHDDYAEADRLALASVGRWPPSGVPRGHLMWSRDQDWPSEWTLTGFDLAHVRGRVAVTRRVLAGQLGVDVSVVEQAEARPREKVGPALQIALRNAMNVVTARERQRRAEAASVPPEPDLTAPATGASPAVAPAERACAGLTGADLARLRTERGLSQRQLAERLGLGHGMVAKAEVAGTKMLGPTMQDALARFLRQAGSATG